MPGWKGLVAKRGRFGVRQRLMLGVGILLAAMMALAGGGVWQLHAMSTRFELKLDTPNQHDAALVEQLSVAATALSQRAGDMQGVFARFGIGGEERGSRLPARLARVDSAGMT